MAIKEIDEYQIGRRIASIRRLLDMTQQELASRTGLTQATIARVEKGRKKKVELNTIYKIAQALNTSVTDLMQPIEDGNVLANTAAEGAPHV